KAFRAWFGARADQLAQDQIRRLRKRGDTIGLEIWKKVAAELKRSKPKIVSTRILHRSSAKRPATIGTRTNVLREKGGGTRSNSTDRAAMIEVFAERFPDLSKRELGKLFDEYRLMGRIDIRWDSESGRYAIKFDQ